MAFNPVSPGTPSYGRIVKITAIGNVAGPTQAIDMFGGGVQTITQTGTVAYSATNLSATESYTISVFITASGADRTVTWDSNWKWTSTKPATIVNGTTGMLLLMNKGATASDIVASWQVLGTG